MATVTIIVVQNGLVIGSHSPLDDITTWVPNYVGDPSINYFESATFVSSQEAITEIYSNLDVFASGDVLITQQQRDTYALSDSIPDPRLAMTLANAKLAAISNVKLYHNYRIQSTYPFQTQNLINGLNTDITTGSAYTATDKTNMNNAINTELAAIRTKTTAINALSTVAAVIAYANYYA